MEPVLNAFVSYQTGELILTRRDASGRLRVERRTAPHASYHKVAEVPAAARRWLDSTSCQGASGSRVEGEFLRVDWRSDEWRRWSVEAEDSPLRAVPHYEADVHPVKRFMADNPDCRVQRPRACYLDLETDSRGTFKRARAGEVRVLCYSLLDEDGEIASAEVLELDTDESERELLLKLASALERFDQVLAWSGDRFDFPVLLGGRQKGEERTTGRFQRLGISFNKRRWLWLDHLACFKRMNMQVAGSGDQKTSFKLQDIAMSLVKQGKNEFDSSKTWDAWVAGGESRRKLLDYCVQDTKLMPLIEKATGYLATFYALCDATGVFPDSRGLFPSGQVDTFLLRLGKQRGHRFPTHFWHPSEDDEKKQFAGAWVMTPKWKGIVRGVHVCDFSRLYPSIIITWNMSPETKVAGSWASSADQIPDGCCRAPGTGVLFRTDVEGILPIALKELIKLRAQWDERKGKSSPGTKEYEDAEKRSNAYKVAMNSFYGVVGSVASRYFDSEIGESVTQTGVFLLHHVIDRSTAKGYDVGYGDTDSGFVRGPSDEEFGAFVKALNADDFPKLAWETGAKVCDVKLAYEKKFDRLCFVSKKRYVGRFEHYKGTPAGPDSKPEIKGLEFKRGDTSLIARRFQERLIRMLVGEWQGRCACGGPADRVAPKASAFKCRKCGEVSDVSAIGFDPATEDVERYRALIAEQRDYVLREEALPLDEILISQSLKKGLDGYSTKTNADGTESAGSPHVRVAKILAARGEDVDVDTKIRYVMVDNGTDKPTPTPADDYVPGVTPIDRYHAWEQKVYPPAKRLLVAAFPDQEWNRYQRVRPKKRPPLRGGAGPGQGVLFAEMAPAGAQVPVATMRPVVPAMRRRGRARPN